MNDNLYYKKYMIKRYHERMNQARQELGGKCCLCSSLEQLEIDHIDKDLKEFTIAKFWSHSKEKFKKELSKCQLLCRKCHQEKTLKGLGQVSAKTTHGTVSSYRYCHCKECRAAQNEYKKEWKRKRKLLLQAPVAE